MTQKLWSFYPGARPWRRGRKKRPADFGPYTLYVIDPDFDGDSESECVWFWRREIEMHGAVAIHPDGDRRHGRDDPVPLHQRSYIGAVTSEYDRRHPYDPEVLPEPEPEPGPVLMLPGKLVEHEPEFVGYVLPVEPPDEDEKRPPSEVLLKYMKLDQPIARGAGRVWKNWVMVNEADVVKRASTWGEEVWRGRGFVLFRMPQPPGPEWVEL